MATFPIRLSNAPDILARIFPSKQADVYRLIQYVSENSCIDNVIIFGSSVTWRCSVSSDIDIAVGADISEDDFVTLSGLMRNVIDSECDILHLNSIKNEMLLNEIYTKGVVVYDRTN